MPTASRAATMPSRSAGGTAKSGVSGAVGPAVGLKPGGGGARGGRGRGAGGGGAAPAVDEEGVVAARGGGGGDGHRVLGRGGPAGGAAVGEHDEQRVVGGVAVDQLERPAQPGRQWRGA